MARQFLVPILLPADGTAALHATSKQQLDAAAAAALSSAQASAAGLYLPILGVIAAKTANYTLADTDAVVVFNTASGSLTATLPTAVGRTGRRFLIKKLGGSTANPLTIASNGGTIDGATSEIVSVAGGFRELISDGTNWLIVGGKVEPVVVTLANVAAAGAINIDASVGSVYRVTVASGACTLSVPTNPIDADAIRIQITATAAATITPNAAIVNCTGVGTPFSIPAGKRLFLGLETIGTTWQLLAYAITP